MLFSCGSLFHLGVFHLGHGSLLGSGSLLYCGSSFGSVLSHDHDGHSDLDILEEMYECLELSDLFDVKSVWDSNRPTPVPKMG